MRWSVILFAAAVVVPFAMHAGDTDSTAPATRTAAQDQTSALDQVVCKRLPPPTGTRLGGKTVCQTRKQWLELEQNSQDMLEKVESGCEGLACSPH
ncbi:MAG: hypothetical protein KGI68_14925 [Alphaproteobacteria bacterium]|nr:hypothetical protein [Alphaproteobacteria bacterium]MDE1985418.1 hypothetical protein [Alphaproteobacteria bacterium]MDE2161511.1 hypothetical protein [Alphaproteobacteria bacterium]